MKKWIFLVAWSLLLPCEVLADVVFSNKSDLRVRMADKEAEVVHTALRIFDRDYGSVFGRKVVRSHEADVIVGTIGNGSFAESALGEQVVNDLRPHKEGYVLLVKEGKLFVLGSDKRGTAYGLLELSRLIGVSPWEWWADSPVAPKEQFVLAEGFYRMEYPSVAYRGIFLNDEDWGLTPWSWQNHEPSEVEGTIGPKTHARIFELLLRLRANTFWPAMHTCSVAFYLTPGNKEVADQYGILVGTSHCEPMARNTNAEWRLAGKGEYDYVHNRENVLRFWEERVRQLAGSDNIYTLGIRGVHDGKMQGADTPDEQKAALERVLKDQREMIARYVNADVGQVPQVFIPYKEVLEAYRAGLEVPEDVTLMWCDDNYGYIRHLPDEQERARKGGNGVYYHVSYWGRPHDYLWLATNHPAQLYTQMKLAYDKGARDMWILNVGDIKPAEYLTELFMDMAWDIRGIKNNAKGLEEHLSAWLSREFGVENAHGLLAVMNEYYRLAYIRKPEFMGNTRTEEKDPAFKVVKDLPWSEAEIKERLQDYEDISERVVQLSSRIAPEKQAAWFQLVEYPVRAAAEMNKKHLYAQLARHGQADWQQSDAAYDAIVALTQKYNSLNGGKWKGIMDFRPRRLPVFDRVPHESTQAPLPETRVPLALLNGVDYTDFTGEQPVSHGMGYRRGAISLSQGSSVAYDFAADCADSLRIEVALAPNHPVEGEKLRFKIGVDDGMPRVIDYHTEGRSEEWKVNTLRNQAIREVVLPVRKKQSHRLVITAVDEGVVVDQVKLYNH